MTVSSVLRGYQRPYLSIWLHSIFITILALVPFIYLLQVHERVYSSRSWETLFFLTLIVALALLTWGVLTHFRNEALRAIGFQIDAALRTKVFDAVHRSGEQDAFRAYQDIANLRSGITGPLVAHVFDASLTPIFIVVLFLLHPVFGWVALGYVAVLASLSQGSRRIWRDMRQSTKDPEDRAFGFGLASAAKQEVVRAMRLLPGVRRHWSGLQAEATRTQMAGQSSAGLVDAIIATLERGQLVLVIGVSALLYLGNEITAATGFAAFMIMRRGVGPILAVAKNWPVLQETRDAMARIDALLDRHSPPPKAPLPALVGQITCAHAGHVTRQGQTILSGVHFALPAGVILGVIGPSGAGKSTLLRMLCGAIPTNAGALTIDDFPIEQWPEDQIGPALGYLPQSVDLLPGSIHDNVARFEGASEAVTEMVVDALGLAGALPIVQAQDRGLEFPLGPEGSPLSGGQRQRIGLARAFYGRPKLLLLDEPSASLDAASETALCDSLVALKEAGSTVIFTTHKAGMLEICDYVLVIMNGYMHSFSTRDDMRNRFRLSGNAMMSLADQGSEQMRGPARKLGA